MDGKSFVDRSIRISGEATVAEIKSHHELTFARILDDAGHMVLPHDKSHTIFVLLDHSFNNTL